jgi:hypothetical protein
VGGPNVERSQDAGGVVRHRFYRHRTFGHRGPSRPTVVEGSQPVAVGEPVELELPRLDGVAEAADEKHVGSLARLLDVNVHVVGGDRVSHRLLL